jgi:polyphosphate kinase
VTLDRLVDGRPPVAGSLFLNRELSWLDFNERVLHEALDDRNPLLQRLRFIGIVSSNLDEFYMVRVAGLRRQVAANVTTAPPDGLSPREQVDAVETRVRALIAEQRRCLEEDLLPALAQRGLRLVRADAVPEEAWPTINEIFEREIFPVLTPLAVDPTHPFPYISNLSLSIAVELRDPDLRAERFARVKVPAGLPRWMSAGEGMVIPVERVIGEHLGALFPGMQILGWYTFRVTRYSDIDLANVEEPEDLLAMIQEEVFRRRFGEVVRLEVESDMPEHLRALLMTELRESQAERFGLRDPAVHEQGQLLDLAALDQLADTALPDDPTVRFAPVAPRTPPELAEGEGSIFDAIRAGDILVHHPFDSFAASTERFFEEAAEDPAVLAVKTTLYRTSGDTAIVQALIDAAQRGKQVAVMVELKARFDEENNIGWARTLEGYGVHVSYGSTQLKTHAKVALVVRRELDTIRRYVHVGTGNYDSRRARLYTDFGLFTVDENIAADVSDLFNSLTGYSGRREFRTLLVAPFGMRDQFLARIDREAMLARAGRPARIVSKMNALVDAGVIEALYVASQAGVQIELIIRGICCLRPGVPGLSENIRVRSIVGRFLEHSRLWYFENGGAEEMLIGSADWMTRNLERRVEAVTPIADPKLRARLRSLIDVWLRDDRQAWTLAPDGLWTQLRPGPIPRGSHEVLLKDPWGALES